MAIVRLFIFEPEVSKLVRQVQRNWHTIKNQKQLRFKTERAALAPNQLTQNLNLSNNNTQQHQPRSYLSLYIGASGGIIGIVPILFFCFPPACNSSRSTTAVLLSTCAGIGNSTFTYAYHTRTSRRVWHHQSYFIVFVSLSHRQAGFSHAESW